MYFCLCGQLVKFLVNHCYFLENVLLAKIKLRFPSLGSSLSILITSLRHWKCARSCSNGSPSSGQRNSQWRRLKCLEGIMLIGELWVRYRRNEMHENMTRYWAVTCMAAPDQGATPRSQALVRRLWLVVFAASGFLINRPPLILFQIFFLSWECLGERRRRRVEVLRQGGFASGFQQKYTLLKRLLGGLQCLIYAVPRNELQKSLNELKEAAKVLVLNAFFLLSYFI